MNVESAVDKFKFLGLTEYQSRVLYALLKSKSSSINNISSISAVPITRVYDIVNQLIDLNFVIKISNKPKLFRVRNVDFVLNDLVSKKEQHMQDVKKDMEEMRNFFKSEQTNGENRILRVEKEIDLVNLLNEELSNAKETVVGFAHQELKHKPLRDSLAAIAESNVDVRLIVHPESTLENTAKLQTKIAEHSLSAYIIDGKKLFFKLNNHDEPIHNLTVINNNDGFKEMLENHFTNYWNKLE
jgi:sugar-specific transcriptional regulator TrmB